MEVEKYIGGLVDRHLLVSIADKDGKVIYVNRKFEEFYGVKLEEIKGKSFSFLRNLDVNDDFYKKLWEEYLSQKKSYKGIFKNRAKGKKVQIMKIIEPIIENEEIKGFIAIGEDITHFSRLMQSQYEKIQKQNDHISYLTKDFFYLFTHDLKTPLNAILNFMSLAEMMLKRFPQKNRTVQKLQENCLLAKENAYIMKNYVENFLNVKRLESGNFQLKIEQFDICNMIETLYKRYHLLYENKRVRIVCDGVSLFTDKLLFLSVTENLFLNALKYATKKVSITVLEENESIKVVVEDDGEGIKKEDKEKIFGKFQQLEEKKSKGVGLGLYLVQKICNILKCDIKVDRSELGGARFTLTFKVQKNSDTSSIKDKGCKR